VFFLLWACTDQGCVQYGHLNKRFTCLRSSPHQAIYVFNMVTVNVFNMVTVNVFNMVTINVFNTVTINVFNMVTINVFDMVTINVFNMVTINVFNMVTVNVFNMVTINVFNSLLTKQLTRATLRSGCHAPAHVRLLRQRPQALPGDVPALHGGQARHCTVQHPDLPTFSPTDWDRFSLHPPLTVNNSGSFCGDRPLLPNRLSPANPARTILHAPDSGC